MDRYVMKDCIDSYSDIYIWFNGTELHFTVDWDTRIVFDDTYVTIEDCKCSIDEEPQGIVDLVILYNKIDFILGRNIL